MEKRQANGKSAKNKVLRGRMRVEESLEKLGMYNAENYNREKNWGNKEGQWKGKPPRGISSRSGIKKERTL